MIIIKKNKITIIGIAIISVIMLVCTYQKENGTLLQTSSTTSKYEILVDVEESILYLFEDGTLSKTYKCSGGKWSTPSPIGTWKITSKDTWGEGFGGHWMGLNVPWGQFGIHRNVI